LLGRVTGGPVEIGTPLLMLTPDDIDKDGMELESVREPTELIRVGYQKNWSVQTDGLYGAVTDDSRALYGLDYSTESATAVTTVNNPRRPDRLSTLLATQTGAATVAARLIALYGVQRRRYRISARRRGWQVSRGDTITIKYPRFGLESGRDFLVTSVERRLDTRSTELVVWG